MEKILSLVSNSRVVDLCLLSRISAPPRIVKLEAKKNFYWCIKYVVTGFPTRTRKWLFNGQRLNLTEDSDIKDLESPPSSSRKFIYTDEGLHAQPMHAFFADADPN